MFSIRTVGAFLACTIGITVCIADPAQGGEAPATFAAQVDSLMEQQRQDQHIPGLVLAIVKDDKIVYLKAFGQRDIEHNLPATADTVFPIGSCTKAFTAMALALGADAGLLTLDDHPRRFLPDFKMVDPEADANVTLRDLLSHRTGLMAHADLAAVSPELSSEEFVLAAASAQPTAKFRTAFQYSNSMMVAAGLVAAKANHASWDQVIANKIFSPLGMNSSTTSTSNLGRIADHTTGYMYDDKAKAWRATPPSLMLVPMAPAGAIASSARDMTQWLRVLSGGGVIGGKRFVSEAMFREMTTPQIVMDPQLSYALGWVIFDWNGNKVVEHDGRSEGISAVVSFMPSRHAGFVILTNAAPVAITSTTYAGKLLWPLILGENAAVPATPAALPQPVPAAVAAVPAGLPSADALLARMIKGAGGKRTLARHRELEIVATKSYDNQGVTAAYTVRARVPTSREETETWSARGKWIGRVRLYFDGTQGGQETTFGQDAVNDAPANAAARRDDVFQPLLDLKKIYKTIDVVDRVKVDGEDAFVVRLANGDADKVLLHVSEKTGRILKRDAVELSVEFKDYRKVDGEFVPFFMIVHDSLGQETVRVTSARFDGAIPDKTFAPAK